MAERPRPAPRGLLSEAGDGSEGVHTQRRRFGLTSSTCSLIRNPALATIAYWCIRSDALQQGRFNAALFVIDPNFLLVGCDPKSSEELTGLQPASLAASLENDALEPLGLLEGAAHQAGRWHRVVLLVQAGNAAEADHGTWRFM